MDIIIHLPLDRGSRKNLTEEAEFHVTMYLEINYPSSQDVKVEP